MPQLAQCGQLGQGHVSRLPERIVNQGIRPLQGSSLYRAVESMSDHERQRSSRVSGPCSYELTNARRSRTWRTRIGTSWTWMQRR